VRSFWNAEVVSPVRRPLQRSLFAVEHQIDLRVFGFFAALLERMPILGLLFSISNRIGAAMMCHDYEKLQVRPHAVASSD
jgi:hypothetical protein